MEENHTVQHAFFGDYNCALPRIHQSPCIPKEPTVSVLQLPVFLPGNNRDWTQVKAIANITEEGEINIRLKNKVDAESLVQMAKDGILLQLAFDYRDVIKKAVVDN